MINQRNYTLDAYRGIAALVVFWAHLAGFMLAPLESVSKANLFEKVMNASSGYGHQAVMVFFVLSGYLISRAIWDKRFNWSPTSYLGKRLARLWVVLLPCLVLTLLFNHFGSLHDSNSYYDGALNYLYKGQRTWAVDLGFSAFVGNMFFLQTIFCRFYGDNEVLWSLANEFWYYILFPSIVFMFFSRTWLRKIACFALAALILGCMPHGMREGFIIWLVGFAVHLVNQSRYGVWFAGKWKFVLSLAVLLFALQATHSFIPSGFVSDFIIAIVFGISTLTALRLDMVPLFARKPVALLSDMSYSLYLAHFSVIACYQTVVLRNVQLPRTMQSIPHVLVFGGSVLVYCFVVYWLFERNTERVRRLFCKFGSR
jgi:peptidoglycan/LPS O-acetylase OafA/YrhL